MNLKISFKHFIAIRDCVKETLNSIEDLGMELHSEHLENTIVPIDCGKLRATMKILDEILESDYGYCSPKE